MLTRQMTEEERTEYCRDMIRDQEESGLSVTRWCALKGVSKARYYRYRRIVQGHEEQSAVREGARAKKPNTVTLEAGGVRITVNEGADWEVACSILKMLREGC